MNLEQAAKNKGLKSFDTALPQGWVDSFVAVTGKSPVGLMVWCYDNATIFGEAVAVTSEGVELLREFNRKQINS